ncbi:MAG: hypothetical protein KF753_15265 [Caldilineaceae bacterium]|nr:hypothetical protein [Caldilineaceae bacterium]
MSEQSVIGVYNTLSEAEDAVALLGKGDFPITQISIVGQDMQSEKVVHGYVTAGDVAKASAGTGAWVGGLFGLLVGAAFIWVPGFGPLLVAGSFSAILLGAMEGAVVGAAGSGILGSLIGWGVSRQHILKYEEHLKGGKYLLMTNGNADEMALAKRILQGSAATTVTLHADTAA